jgi:hypothetical protein
MRKPFALAEKQIQKLFALHQCKLAMQKETVSKAG